MRETKLKISFKEKYPFDADEIPESDKVMLDNMDWARLTYDSTGEVVVENEHCTQFDVSDLSDNELELFEINM